MNDYITVIKTKRPCNKKVTIDADGELSKEPSGFSSGFARSVRISSLKEFKEIPMQISEDPCLTMILGFVGGTEPADNENAGEEFIIVPKAHMASLLDVPEEGCTEGIKIIDDRKVVTRAKANFKPSSLMLFDYDHVKGMPDNLVFTDPLVWWEKMIELIPALEGVGHIITPSTTSRIMLNGKPAYDKSGFHAYVQVKDPNDIERFGRDLVIYSLSTDYGFRRSLFSRENGEVTGHRPWTITDPSTFTTGRLVFDGKPVVNGEGLSVAPVELNVIEGLRLDTSLLEITEGVKSEVKERTGFSVETYKGKSSFLNRLVNDIDLKMDTPIDTEKGDMAFSDYWLSDNEHLRCQTPFREDSSSMAAFLGRHKDGIPFLFDVGVVTKYIIRDGVVELANIIESENIDILAKAMVRQKAFIRQKVQRILKKRNIINKGDFKELVDEYKKENTDTEYDIMKSLLQDYGADNVVFSEDALWMWSKVGVWKQFPEEYIDQILIMHPLCFLYDKSYVSAGMIRGLNQLLRKEVAIIGGMQPYISSRYINCINGELHWDGDWVLSNHDKSNRSTNQCNFIYNQHAECSRWDKFLHEIFDGTSDKNGIDEQIELLQAMFGYSMTSDTSLERFIVLQGPGGNGKSVLLFLLQHLVGKENSSGVQPDQLDNRFQLGHMANKLVNVVSEVGLDDVLPDKKIKSISSGENTTVEHKNKNPFDTCLYSTLWFASNPVPAVRDYSDAFFERAIYFKLPNVFRGTETQDLDLQKKLQSESAGIARKCLESYGRVLNKGRIALPEVMKSYIEEWRAETDHVRVFVDDSLILSPEHQVSLKELYSHYKTWVSENDIRYKLTQRSLLRRMTATFKLNKCNGTGHVAILMGAKCKKWELIKTPKNNIKQCVSKK